MLKENIDTNLENKNEPVLVIMAAGMGSRFGGLKQMTPVSGKDEMILDFSLYDAFMAGFRKAIIIIKKENEEDFKKLIKNKAGKFMDIEFAFQDLRDLPEGFDIPEDREKPLGTGHATLSCRHLVDGPFAVINSDDFYGATAFQLMYDFLAGAEDKEKYSYSMVAYPIENTLTDKGFVSRGVCEVSSKGILERVTERTKIKRFEEGILFEDESAKDNLIPEGTPVSMNFWGFTKSFMEEGWAGFSEALSKILTENPMKGEYYLPSIVSDLIEKGKAEVKVLKTPDRWYGVTYKEDLEDVVSALQSMKDNGLYPEILWG